MLERTDPDQIPTLDEESLSMKERERLEHWASNSPRASKLYQMEGQRGSLAMMARVHLHNIRRKVDAEVYRNPHLSRQEIEHWFDDEMWKLPPRG